MQATAGKQSEAAPKQVPWAVQVLEMLHQNNSTLTRLCDEIESVPVRLMGPVPQQGDAGEKDPGGISSDPPVGTAIGIQLDLQHRLLTRLQHIRARLCTIA